MTAKKLIEYLQQLPQDASVRIFESETFKFWDLTEIVYYKEFLHRDILIEAHVIVLE